MLQLEANLEYIFGLNLAFGNIEYIKLFPLGNNINNLVMHLIAPDIKRPQPRPQIPHHPIPLLGQPILPDTQLFQVLKLLQR
jgi:hypothetical protein